MTLGHATWITAGLAGAFALGVLAGPGITGDTVWDEGPHTHAPWQALAAVTLDAPKPTVAAAPKPVPPAVSPTAPELQQRLKPVLNQGTDLRKAAEGFVSAEQFATLAYASRNTNVPFVVLKHRVLNEGRSLSSAIHESAPAVNAVTAVQRARAQARSTIASLRS